MSINIWTDSMQHAALLGKPVLFTNWLIQRDIIPDGWYCYDLRGTHKSPSTRTTLVDHAADYFPEFNYESFWRLLDRISISSSSSRLEFQKNEYSTYNRRTHFTPIWYPDGSYTVNTWVIDCWTPAGMLSVNLTDSLNIRGNLWDDWHIAPLDL